MRRLWLLAAAAAPPVRDLRFPGQPVADPPVVLPGEVEGVAARVARADEAFRAPEDAAASTCAALDVSAAPVAQLRARSFGAWAGRSVEEVAGEEPDAFTAWRQDPTFAPPEGESIEDLCARVGSWLDGQAELDGTALVVADAGVVTAAAVTALAAGPESCWHLDVGALGLARVQCAHGTWRLRSLEPARRR